VKDAFRPASFAEFVGQDKPKRVLEILVRAARKRGGCVPHCLLSGPPGLGKTTLARIIANEMGSRLVEIVATHLQSPGELLTHLKGLQKGDVLFIDEIHALASGGGKRNVEEALYGAMEDFRVCVQQDGFDKLMRQLGMGAAKPTTQTIELPRFTCVGATTAAGCLSSPLRQRFLTSLVLQPYSPEDLATIIMTSASEMGLPLAPEMALKVARRSRETARVAIGHVRWIAEYCEAEGKPPNSETIDEAFDLKEVDEQGLTKQDRDYLRALVDAAAPTGLSTLSAALGEARETIEQAQEGFLLRKGFIQKTPRGRVALPKAIDWVGTEEQRCRTAAR
jgi:Holliday junction DNA helicase RuvB